MVKIGAQPEGRESSCCLLGLHWNVQRAPVHLGGCAGAVVAEAVGTGLGAVVPPCHHVPKCFGNGSERSWCLVRAWLQLGQGLLEVCGGGGQLCCWAQLNVRHLPGSCATPALFRALCGTAGDHLLHGVATAVRSYFCQLIPTQQLFINAFTRRDGRSCWGGGSLVLMFWRSSALP